MSLIFKKKKGKVKDISVVVSVGMIFLINYQDYTPKEKLVMRSTSS